MADRTIAIMRAKAAPGTDKKDQPRGHIFDSQDKQILCKRNIAEKLEIIVAEMPAVRFRAARYFDLCESCVAEWRRRRIRGEYHK